MGHAIELESKAQMGLGTIVPYRSYSNLRVTIFTLEI